MRESALSVPLPERMPLGILRRVLLGSGLVLGGLILWQALIAVGNPNPLGPHTKSSAAVLDIGVLVFREGLECVLVLAAITAGMNDSPSSRNAIAFGAAAGFLATLATWAGAVRVLDDLGQSVPALALQAATGLLAVVVLLIVMNWFFHKVYWTQWISFHNRRKRALVNLASEQQVNRSGLFVGMTALGFTSFYREGFEVVLFLQGYRLKLGSGLVLWGVCAGILLSAIVAVLTFVVHQRLPYRKMLVLTGILLGVVLIVMVGEQAQEMQLAHWITTTNIRWLDHAIPSWMGLWLSVFPTAEPLVAQAAAALLVVGSYFAANRVARRGQSPEQVPGAE